MVESTASDVPSLRVRGFHGTTLSRAENILSEGFEPSTSADDWLGTGIYFFEKCTTLAKYYAKRKAQDDFRSKGTEQHPVIIAADIVLENCIDLMEYRWLQQVKKLGQQRTSEGRLLSQNGLRLRTAAGKILTFEDHAPLADRYRKNFADCEVMNALSAKVSFDGKPADCVRSPFVFGRQLYANSYFFDQTHVQIAVINADILERLSLYRLDGP